MAKNDKPFRSVKQEGLETTEEPLLVKESLAEPIKAPEIVAPEVSPIPSAPKFPFCLVVRNPFVHAKRGDLISDDVMIQSVLDQGFKRNCARVPR